MTTKPSNISELIEKTRDLTLEELVGQTQDLLHHVAPHQSRYKVTERPDVRTIRYYINQKLLPGPDGYREGKARYSGRHLLRLLVIKKLQAEHQTLRQIGRRLDSSTQTQLAALIEADEGTAPRVVPPLRPVPPAQDTPAVSTGGEQMVRHTLHPGGTVDLPASLLEDNDTRQNLARQLEALAQRLRQQQDKESQ